MTATDNIVRYDCAIVNRLIFIFVRRGWSLGYYLVEKFGLYLLWKIHTLLDLQYKLEFIFLFQIVAILKVLLGTKKAYTACVNLKFTFVYL